MNKIVLFCIYISAVNLPTNQGHFFVGGWEKSPLGGQLLIRSNSGVAIIFCLRAKFQSKISCWSNLKYLPSRIFKPILSSLFISIAFSEWIQTWSMQFFLYTS